MTHRNPLSMGGPAAYVPLSFSNIEYLSRLSARSDGILSECVIRLGNYGRGAECVDHPLPNSSRSRRSLTGDVYSGTAGGSSDPDKNLALSNTLKRARLEGVPKANIETALLKARIHLSRLSMSLDGDHFRQAAERTRATSLRRTRRWRTGPSAC